MASLGPNYPLTIVNDSTLGVVSWTSLSSAGVEDGNGATATLGILSTTKFLKCTDYGFSVPSGATINGIEVQVVRLANYYNVIDASAKIVKGGTISGTEKKDTAYWATGSYETVTYGGASDLWGLSWTDTDINVSTFGFALHVINESLKFTDYPKVDVVKITVYYTSGGGSPQTDAILFGGN